MSITGELLNMYIRIQTLSLPFPRGLFGSKIGRPNSEHLFFYNYQVSS